MINFLKQAKRFRLISIVLVFCTLQCGFIYMVTGAGSSARRVKQPARSHPAPQAAGAAGSLDPSFGQGGKVTTDFNGNRDQAFDVAFQPDGKIVAVGSAIVNAAQQSDFALARYNSDGSLDTAFGSGGKVTTDFGGDDDAVSVAIQSDGKIVAVGGTCRNSALGCTIMTGSGYDYAIARYNTNGTLDGGFGSGGQVITDFNGGLDFASSVVIQHDGKIVVGGTSCADSSMFCVFTGGVQFSLARYNTDGSLDSSFGSGGKVFTPVPQFGYLKTLALQTDGKIVAVGLAHPNGDADYAVARYNVDGTLDSSFGNQGIVTTDFNSTPGNPSVDTAYGVAIQTDGKIVASGASETLTENFFNLSMARYNTDGTLDSSFGNGGRVLTSISGKDDQGASIALQSDGKILVGGIAGGFVMINGDEAFIVDDNTVGGSDFALARYNTDGSLDTTFGDQGMVTTDFFGFDDGARFAIQPDGLVVGAGFARHQESSVPDLMRQPRKKGRFAMAILASALDTEADADFALARYETAVQPDFSLSPSQPTVTASRGTKITVTIDVNRIAGLTGKITVTPPGPPATGIKIPQTPVTTKGDQVSFTIKVKGAAPAGSYPLTFTGSDKSGQSHSTTLTLVVQ